MEKTVPSWSDINRDLLSEIADRINCMRDFIIFGTVCKSWRSVASPDKFNKSTKIPWLLLDQDKYDHTPRKFFDLSKDVIYSIDLPKPYLRKVQSSIARKFYLPRIIKKFFLCSYIKEKQYFLSSKGWYMIVEKEIQLSLLNPFSLSRINLPHPFPVAKDYKMKDFAMNPYITKFVLSTSPSSSSDFTIMILYRLYSFDPIRLAFWKNGDGEWSDVDLKFYSNFVDLTYHNGRYYAGHLFDARFNGPILIDYPNGYVVYEIDVRNSASVSTRTKSFSNPYMNTFCRFPFWIVGSSRVLLMVSWRVESLKWERGRGPCYLDTLYSHVPHCQFIVDEVDFEKGEGKVVSSFGEEALFLGLNSSYLVDASKESRFKSNHIYFAENFQKFWSYHEGGGVGVYNMIDGSSKPLFNATDSKYICSSQWIEPRL
ncbi:uncharacterized protein LOC126662087 [Mercurialis annua]|uniref:uncharacterized protein LOC126662087 n=1 Tax=Mercurialis annua TaxID=3986 RepID=UPI00215E3CEE|nr:uncharacterized protein LOC126662087 [Mercurialis annua]